MKTLSTLCLSFILLFASNTASAQYLKLFDFDYEETGAYPHYGALVSDGTYLYGTTSNGGVEHDGVVFKIKKDGSNFSVLHEFTEDEGFVPESGVIFAGDYLYGTTVHGGTLNGGTVYRLKPDGTDYSVVVNFDGAVQGKVPTGCLYYDGTMLYGMANQGGPNNSGTIYQLAPDGSDFSMVFAFSFDVTMGRSPNGHLISDGTYFYGMTVGGGSLGQGVAFRVKKDGTEYLTLVDLIDDPTGSWGYGSLVYDGTEYLYGMTNTGGDYNRGTIFKVKTDGSGYDKLLDMEVENGVQPLGSPILVGSTIYGMTELSGLDANGNLYSIATDGSDLQTLVDFEGDNGSLPFGTLLHEDGVLYGMTTEGGVNNRGVVFRFGLPLVIEAEGSGSTALKLYPNPVQEFCSIQLPASMRDCTIELHTAQGSIVFTEKISGTSAKLDLRQIPSGVYVMKVQKEGQVVVKKLVVE